MAAATRAGAAGGPPPVAWRARLLGGLRLERVGGESGPPLRYEAQLLLGYLLAQDTPPGRNQVVADLWPDEPEELGRRHLSRLLWELRQALPALFEPPGRAAAVLLRRSAVWVDVAEFGRLVAKPAAGGRREEHRLFGSS